MGTRIESAAIATGRGRLFGRGALHLSDAAARTALHRGHRDAGELDILVNAGLYKDHNLAEPALASIIQEDVGANPAPALGHHGTFSFDVLDGGCGALTAARIVDGFVGSGAARLGMVVASDADPSPRTSRGFHFAPAGGALLLAHDAGATGFVDFASRTFADDAALFEVDLRWDPDAGRHGRNLLEVHEAPAFCAHCVDHAIEVAAAFLDDHDVDVDLLIASQYPRGFADEVATGLGIPAARVPQVRGGAVGAHTAGPIVALDAAIASGRFAAAHDVLFVTAGAGISIAVALYHAS